ncbi:MAG: hypothetical protein EOP66_09145 [Sphingomonas sp.]|nr:MAG: hypothetical protein EOP66_09145 [Sphingomonas sp.]
MTDPAAIAASLTKAQREALLNPLEISAGFTLWYDTNRHTAYALHRRDLVDDHFHLTDLGLAVRQHLHDAAHLQQNGEGVKS